MITKNPGLPNCCNRYSQGHLHKRWHQDCHTCRCHRRLPVGRGTIQEDTLSPQLCLIFIEPLLRWLQHGVRGYAHGCLAGTQLPRTVAALAYADDLKALASTLSNTKLQAENFERFSTWSGMEMNAKKSAATAAPHGQASMGLAMRPGADKLRRARLEDQIKMGRGTVPYLPPDQPYRYLGVLFTIQNSWSSSHL